MAKRPGGRLWPLSKTPILLKSDFSDHSQRSVPIASAEFARVVVVCASPPAWVYAANGSELCAELGEMIKSAWCGRIAPGKRGAPVSLGPRSGSCPQARVFAKEVNFGQTPHRQTISSPDQGLRRQTVFGKQGCSLFAHP